MGNAHILEGAIKGRDRDCTSHKHQIKAGCFVGASVRCKALGTSLGRRDTSGPHGLIQRSLLALKTHSWAEARRWKFGSLLQAGQGLVRAVTTRVQCRPDSTAWHVGLGGTPSSAPYSSACFWAPSVPSQHFLAYYWSNGVIYIKRSCASTFTVSANNPLCKQQQSAVCTHIPLLHAISVLENLAGFAAVSVMKDLHVHINVNTCG